MNTLKTYSTLFSAPFSFSAPFVKMIVMLAMASSMIACQGQPSAQTLSDSSYTVIDPAISVSTGDKIEVVELFWYGCGHCFALEPAVEKWKKDIPENAEFVKVPAIFSSRWEFHGKAYYAMEALGVLEEANAAFFHRIHVLRKPISSLESLVDFLAAYDKTEAEVTSAFNSFAVDTKLRNAKRLTAKSTAQGVPAILVDGKYHTSVSLAGSEEQLFTTINQLIDKAASER